MDAENLIKERNKAYGNAWKLHGLALVPILPQVFGLMQTHPKYIFSWMLIFNKLIRALTTPENVDHWKDIQGYAQLVIDDLQTNRS